MKTVVLASLACSAISPATAQPAAGSPPGRWVVNGSDHYCSVTRTSQDPTPITFSLRTVPGYPVYELLMVSPRWSITPLTDRQEVDLIVDPAGISFRDAPRAVRARGEGAPFVAFTALPPAFADAFAQNNVVRIARHGETRIHFTYRQADRAISALRECVRFTLERWGIDTAAWAALSRAPRRISPWLSTGDYPREAVRDSQVGGLTVLLSIDATGAITNCRILASSEHAALDRTSCSKARGPGFFEPALNLEGQPVPAVSIQRITFQIEARP